MKRQRKTTSTDGQGTRTFTYNDALQLAAETNALAVLTPEWCKNSSVTKRRQGLTETGICGMECRASGRGKTVGYARKHWAIIGSGGERKH